MRAALGWARQLGAALVELHAGVPPGVPYVHGDVTADNVFLTDVLPVDAAVVKLVDLKPHRHIYNKAHWLLSQANQLLEDTHAQASLAGFTQDTPGSSADDHPAPETPAAQDASTAPSAESALPGALDAAEGGPGAGPVLRLGSGALDAEAGPRRAAQELLQAHSARLDSLGGLGLQAWEPAAGSGDAGGEVLASKGGGDDVGHGTGAGGLPAAPQQQRQKQQQQQQKQRGGAAAPAGAVAAARAAPGSGGSHSGGGGGDGGDDGEGCAWTLSASGAASPRGSSTSRSFDLFADVLEQQQSMASDLPSLLSFSHGPVAAATASLPRMVYVTAPGSWSMTPELNALAALPPSSPGSRHGSSAGGGASGSGGGDAGAEETTVHGGSVALHALTAIDSIAEESSSLCTSGAATPFAGRSPDSSTHGGGGHRLPQSGSLPNSHGGGGGGGGGGGRNGGGAGGQVEVLQLQRSASAPPLDALAGLKPSKRVRFRVERPAGHTPARTLGLLYTAPEVARGERPTEKVDVFAFGVLLYELLARSLTTVHVGTALGGSGRNGAAAAAAAADAAAADAADGGAVDDGATAADAARDDSLASGAAVDASVRESCASGSASGQGVLLGYARRVAEGFRPPLLPHWPPAVTALICDCWSQEAHERPRMAEVVERLEALAADPQVLSALERYNLALAAMEAEGVCGCGCVVC